MLDALDAHSFTGTKHSWPDRNHGLTDMNTNEEEKEKVSVPVEMGSTDVGGRI